MTLTLARASAAFILQVTDRLLTVKKTGQPGDKTSNKNILYFASNAIVAIAYSGDAHLDGIPTDHWIAQKLAGVEIDPINPPAVMLKDEDRRDIGLAFHNLKSELNSRARKVEYLLLTLQGWQWDSKGRIRPLVGDIMQTAPGKDFRIYYEPRNWYIEGASMTIAAPPSNISQRELEDLSIRLRGTSASEAESLLVNKIRELSQAQEQSYIGPHCISIQIPPPSDPNIIVRYLAADPTTISKLQRLDEYEAIWAYSPWIISQKICKPPSEIIGGFTLSTGLFSINFDAKTFMHPKWLFSDAGQKRK